MTIKVQAILLHHFSEYGDILFFLETDAKTGIGEPLKKARGTCVPVTIERVGLYPGVLSIQNR